jgi:hypothetical protein
MLGANVTIIDRILALAEANSLNLQELEYLAQEKGVSLVQACDDVALDVARNYGERKIDFDKGDRILNELFRTVTTAEFFSRSDRKVPPMVMSVYLAFDEGEYIHHGDLPGIAPEDKYTRPMIAAILAATDGI